MRKERQRAAQPQTGAIDWAAVGDALDEDGAAVVPGLLCDRDCRDLIDLYDQTEHFRSTIDMARHGFGSGQYRYFDYPLPPVVQALRQSLYPPLALIANRWCERLGEERRFPPLHDRFLAECHDAGQRRATPLLLRYGHDDYNCLHQDLYGPLVFPLQAAILLSAPGSDFEGGEFVLTEQRPRQQSRALVMPLAQGDAVLFPVNRRPRRGRSGDHRTTMRHGVSRVRRGLRFTMGIIFHDAA